MRGRGSGAAESLPSPGRQHPVANSTEGIAAMATTMASSATKLSLNSSFSGSKLRNARTPAPVVAVVAAPLQVEAMKKIQGRVVCAASDKTIAVEVTRIAPHLKYKKRIKTSKKYHVHDPENACKVGDIVTVAKCKPISKTKNFIVVEVKAGRLPGEKAPAPTLPPFESDAAPVAA